MSKVRERKIRSNLIIHAINNNLFFNPNFSIRDWASMVIKKGGCPCVPDRPDCPCEQSLNEIQNEGRCKCGFFYNYEKYLELLEINK